MLPVYSDGSSARGRPADRKTSSRKERCAQTVRGFEMLWRCCQVILHAVTLCLFSSVTLRLLSLCIPLCEAYAGKAVCSPSKTKGKGKKKEGGFSCFSCFMQTIMFAWFLVGCYYLWNHLYRVSFAICLALLFVQPPSH